jgi:zinc/manganese transport system substrate-binding protein
VTVLDAPSAPVSRAQGDVHPGGNPHYLLDPKNGAKCGHAIAERLAAIDPSHATAYRDRAAVLEKAAMALAASQAARFNALGADKKNVVVYHKSWAYLLGWLGLHESGSVEPKPGIPPDPGHVASLLGQMRASHVRALVQEDYYPQTTSKLLASKTGAALVVVPGGTADGQRYVDHLKDVADRVFAALSR